MIFPYHDEGMTGRVVEIVSGGGVVIMPCDTIYGFIGKYPDTDRRIRALKGRDEKKPFLVLSSEACLDSLTDRQIPEEFRKYWPGPLTLILYKKNGRTTVAVRIPDDPILLQIIDAVGAPVFSTSVNRSGSEALHGIEQIRKEFENEVDLIVDGGNREGGSPSTIVDITSRPYRLVRRGSLVLDIEDTSLLPE
jgi:L-threonylcarbamoyladenylate synthase